MYLRTNGLMLSGLSGVSDYQGSTVPSLLT